ncbi:MAG: hypothetical protein WAT19_13770 [Ferruginibacter sp.]
MLKATTLVHKGAMQIGLHAISSFARHFSKTHEISIHTDPSVGQEDQQLLLQAAAGMKVKIISASERALRITPILSQYPRISALLRSGSFFTKLELPMYEGSGLFYFDSDIIWLRHAEDLQPKHAPNAFSTETWTWYPGIKNEDRWMASAVPRRVNSGFYYLNEPFPYEKLELLLSHDMFDKEVEYAGDQELFAFLYNNMEYYHPKDLMRSRIGTTYKLRNEKCAAIHFPGKMWMNHLDQIEQLHGQPVKPAIKMRYRPPVPITAVELYKMRILIKAGKSTTLAGPLNLLRSVRRIFG